jgi:hypothetical protein
VDRDSRGAVLFKRFWDTYTAENAFLQVALTVLGRRW